MTEGDPMTEDRQWGDIATRLLMENDRVRIWEMRMAPGEMGALHEHHNDYVMIQISGDRVAAHFEPDSAGEWEGLDYVEGEVVPGMAIYARAGGRERAANIGDQEFHEIIVELK